MNTVKEKIKSFVLRSFRLEDLEDDVNFNERGFANSLFAMQLIMFIENEFNISVDNDDMDISNFNSIQNITNFVCDKIDG